MLRAEQYDKKKELSSSILPIYYTIDYYIEYYIQGVVSVEYQRVT